MNRLLQIVSAPRRRRPLAPRRQEGMTLVELMVAMVLGLLVVLAAVSALIMSRQGLTTLDAASQLRDNSRFAADFIQRLALQAGYVDASNMNPRNVFQANAGSVPPAITGFDNATPGTWSGNDTSASTKCAAGQPCGDVLILSNQVGPDMPSSPGGTLVVSQAMINCIGAPGSPDTVLYSAFYIAISNSGEPALMCRYQAPNTGNWSNQPILQGVEGFQVLYGVDGVTPAATTLPASTTVPTRYLRADQLTVPGNATATQNNWRRVRTLRIGLVFRGPLGSVATPRTDTLYPLGPDLASTADVGTQINPSAINDTRLRSVLTFTVQLRNYQVN